MRKLLLGIACLTLVSCDKLSLDLSGKSKRFGSGFDDCLLTNLKPGLANETVGLIRQSCVRVWQKDSDQPFFFDVKKQPGNILKFSGTNSTPDIVTKVQAAVTFKGSTEKQNVTLYWTFDGWFEPGADIEEIGNYVGVETPSDIVSEKFSESRVMKVIAVQSASK